MQASKSDYRLGATPVESRQAGEVPGSLPRKSPPQATGGASASTWGTRSGAQRKSTTGHTKRVQQPKSVKHTLKILQWNAEGISKKKTSPNIQTSCCKTNLLEVITKGGVLYNSIRN